MWQADLVNTKERIQKDINLFSEMCIVENRQYAEATITTPLDKW